MGAAWCERLTREEQQQFCVRMVDDCIKRMQQDKENLEKQCYGDPAATKEKQTAEASGAGVHIGIAAMQGWRKAMEDVHCVNVYHGDGSAFVGVFDGHCGSVVAKQLPDLLPALAGPRVAPAELREEEEAHAASVADAAAELERVRTEGAAVLERLRAEAAAAAEGAAAESAAELRRFREEHTAERERLLAEREARLEEGRAEQQRTQERIAVLEQQLQEQGDAAARDLEAAEAEAQRKRAALAAAARRGEELEGQLHAARAHNVELDREVTSFKLLYCALMHRHRAHAMPDWFEATAKGAQLCAHDVLMLRRILSGTAYSRLAAELRPAYRAAPQAGPSDGATEAAPRGSPPGSPAPRPPAGDAMP